METEDRITQAVVAYRNGEFKSMLATARHSQNENTNVLDGRILCWNLRIAYL